MRLLLTHLVRASNGMEPLRRFLDSYRQHAAGVDHDLLLALKGFSSPTTARSAVELVRSFGVHPEFLELDDGGFDLTAYGRVIRERPADRHCFVNSFSRVLAGGWLAHLDQALEDPRVEIAGASGSWASQQDYRRFQLGLPSGYSSVFSGREPTRRGFLELARQRDPGKRDLGPLPLRARALVDLIRDRGGFPAFPAPHLRTNAFILRGTTAKGLALHQVTTKLNAYRMESGHGGMSGRALARDRRLVVVDRNGHSWDVPDWGRSRTLWANEQEGLLVADNQTDDYAAAAAEVRVLLSRLAWGIHGDFPPPPRTRSRQGRRSRARRPAAS